MCRKAWLLPIKGLLLQQRIPDSSAYAAAPLIMPALCAQPLT